MFGWRTKKSSLKAIIGLRNELIHKFGQHSVFKAEDVVSVFRAHKLPKKYLVTAISLYCSENEYDQTFKDHKTKPDYEVERGKVLEAILKRVKPVSADKPSRQSSAHDPSSNESAAASYGIGLD